MLTINPLLRLIIDRATSCANRSGASACHGRLLVAEKYRDTIIYIGLKYLSSIVQLKLDERSCTTRSSTKARCQHSSPAVFVQAPDLLTRTSMWPSLTMTDCTAALQDSSDSTSSWSKVAPASEQDSRKSAQAADRREVSGLSRPIIDSIRLADAYTRQLRCWQAQLVVSAIPAKVLLL